MKFEHKVRNLFSQTYTVGIFKVMSTERETSLTQRQSNEDFNPFFFALTLESPNRATKEKVWEILENF